MCAYSSAKAGAQSPLSRAWTKHGRARLAGSPLSLRLRPSARRTADHRPERPKAVAPVLNVGSLPKTKERAEARLSDAGSSTSVAPQEDAGRAPRVIAARAVRFL